MSRIFRLCVRWLPAVTWAALIFILSSQPALPLADRGRGLPVTQAGHMVEYAVLALLLLWALVYRRAPSVSLPALALLALVLSVAYGVSDELHQAFVPLRQASLTDVVLDGLGAALALLTAVVVGRRLRARG